MSVTHLAGLEVVVCGRQIQRCAICGVKLVDSKGAMIESKDARKGIPFWLAGSLVRESGGNPNVWTIIETPADNNLPDDSCIELVED